MEKIVGFVVLISGFCYLHNKIRLIVKIQKNKKLLKEAQMKKQKEYLKKLKKYNVSGMYSICLSIDYKVIKGFTKEDKLRVNNAIFSELARYLKKHNPEITAKKTKEAILILSGNFNKYDKIYTTLLESLSKIKNQIENKYEVKIIPNITTDAYAQQPDSTEILENHFNIKQCNLTNMSCSTKEFCDKYKNFNNKYVGKPIGEYGLIGKEKDSIYELNMVCENLSSKLERLGQ